MYAESHRINSTPPIDALFFMVRTVSGGAATRTKVELFMTRNSHFRIPLESL